MGIRTLVLLTSRPWILAIPLCGGMAAGHSALVLTSTACCPDGRPSRMPDGGRASARGPPTTRLLCRVRVETVDHGQTPDPRGGGVRGAPRRPASVPRGHEDVHLCIGGPLTSNLCTSSSCLSVLHPGFRLSEKWWEVAPTSQGSLFRLKSYFCRWNDDWRRVQHSHE